MHEKASNISSKINIPRRLSELIRQIKVIVEEEKTTLDESVLINVELPLVIINLVFCR